VQAHTDTLLSTIHKYLQDFKNTIGI